jgi:uncharacterized protein (DUF433 family)
MRLPERIAVDPEIMMGDPCVKGTRIPVYVLLQKMAAGESEAEILQAYPQLRKADLIVAWVYAARAAYRRGSVSGILSASLIDEDLSCSHGRCNAARPSLRRPKPPAASRRTLISPRFLKTQ